MLVMALINFPTLSVFSDLRARLLSFESHLSLSSLSDSTAHSNTSPPTALLSSRGRGHPSRGGRNRCGSFGGRTDSSPTSQSGRGNFSGSSPGRGGPSRGNRGRGRMSPTPGILGPHPSTVVQCQICSRYGHGATTSYNSYRDETQFEDDLSSTFAGMQIALPVDPN